MHQQLRDALRYKQLAATRKVQVLRHALDNCQECTDQLRARPDLYQDLIEEALKLPH